LIVGSFLLGAVVLFGSNEELRLNFVQGTEFRVFIDRLFEEVSVSIFACLKELDNQLVLCIVFKGWILNRVVRHCLFAASQVSIRQETQASLEEIILCDRLREALIELLHADLLVGLDNLCEVGCLV